MTDLTADEMELRVRVAEIAIRPFMGGPVVMPDEIGRVFDVLLDRIKGQKMPGTGLPCIERSGRHAMMLSPITNLIDSAGRGTMVIEKLHAVGIYQTGALLQWQPTELKDHARLTDNCLHIVQQSLASEGLTLGMDVNTIRQWIEQGTHHASQDS